MTSENGYYRSFTGTGTAPLYWVASEFSNASLNNVSWGFRYVQGGGVSCVTVFPENPYTFGCGIRPIVTINSDISLKWNETAQEWKIQ